MRSPVLILGASICVAFTPIAASACEFDGLPGFHRFNPFLNEAKSRWPAQPLPEAAESFEERDIDLAQPVEDNTTRQAESAEQDDAPRVEEENDGDAATMAAASEDDQPAT